MKRGELKKGLLLNSSYLGCSYFKNDKRKESKNLDRTEDGLTLNTHTQKVRGGKCGQH